LLLPVPLLPPPPAAAAEFGVARAEAARLPPSPPPDDDVAATMAAQGLAATGADGCSSGISRKKESRGRKEGIDLVFSISSSDRREEKSLSSLCCLPFLRLCFSKSAVPLSEAGVVLRQREQEREQEPEQREVRTKREPPSFLKEQRNRHAPVRMKKSEAGPFHFLPCPHLEERTTPICCELASLSRLLQLLSFHPRDPYPSMTSGGGFGVTAKAISTTSSNETKSAAETAAAVKKFTALGVCEQLAEAAAALGWTAPTEIQAAAVPHLLAGTACEEKEEREGEKERAEHSTSGDGLLSPPPKCLSSLTSLVRPPPCSPCTLPYYHSTLWHEQARTSSASRRPGAARRAPSPCPFFR